MAIPRIISDLAGTARTALQIGLTSAAAVLKSVTGGIVVRNKGDSADAPLTASELRASGDAIKINSDAAGSGADYEYSLERPATGMTAAAKFVFPPDEGSPGQVATTDGAGNVTWETPSAGTSNGLLYDTTTLSYGDSTPLAMFTKPASSNVPLIKVRIVTPFNGTAPTISIGIVGTTSKYVTTGQTDLKADAGTTFDIDPGLPLDGSESLIITYNADSSSAGEAEVLTFYGQPN